MEREEACISQNSSHGIRIERLCQYLHAHTEREREDEQGGRLEIQALPWK
ncbi:hypothetical protein C1H46_006177 [Malus baccata]|uniref:Uncharacterized protein n=1 Tax=Malus baccata TaxID=106549 RepID=A0A540NCH9_MALBA|nr:hypothetical protein C1H46_006177 [Malus baccata]